MKNRKPKRYEIWFDRAKDDIKYAEGNLGLKFYTQVCFLTQQAAEKALKAYLISQGISSKQIKIHPLPRLVEKCLRFDSSFKSLKRQCQILNRYYIPSNALSTRCWTTR